jgi:hypothetical protein
MKFTDNEDICPYCHQAVCSANFFAVTACEKVKIHKFNLRLSQDWERLRNCLMDEPAFQGKVPIVVYLRSELNARQWKIIDHLADNVPNEAECCRICIQCAAKRRLPNLLTSSIQNPTMQMLARLDSLLRLSKDQP